MLVTDIQQVTRQRAPMPGGPIATPLIPAGTSSQVAVIHIEIPAGGGMPEHDHGDSEIVLIPLSGSFDIHHDGKIQSVSVGNTVHIGTGERVRLANPGTESATVMVLASPPQFAERVASWPAA